MLCSARTIQASFKQTFLKDDHFRRDRIEPRVLPEERTDSKTSSAFPSRKCENWCVRMFGDSGFHRHVHAQRPEVSVILPATTQHACLPAWICWHERNFGELCRQLLKMSRENTVSTQPRAWRWICNHALRTALSCASTENLWKIFVASAIRLLNAHNTECAELVVIRWILVLWCSHCRDDVKRFDCVCLFWELSFSFFTLYIINGSTVEPICPSVTNKVFQIWKCTMIIIYYHYFNLEDFGVSEAWPRPRSLKHLQTFSRRIHLRLLSPLSSSSDLTSSVPPAWSEMIKVLPSV